MNEWNMHSSYVIKQLSCLTTFNEFVRPIDQGRTIKCTVHASKIIWISECVKIHGETIQTKLSQNCLKIVSKLSDCLQSLYFLAVVDIIDF